MKIHSANIQFDSFLYLCIENKQAVFDKSKSWNDILNIAWRIRLASLPSIGMVEITTLCS